MAIPSRDILQISRNAAGGIATEYRPGFMRRVEDFMAPLDLRTYLVKKSRTKQDNFSALAAHLPLGGQCNGKL